MSEEMFEQYFQVGEPASLDLSNIRGSVRVSPQSPDVAGRTIIVKAIKDVESGDGELTEIEMMQKENSAVVIKTHFDGLAFPGFLKLKHLPCKVYYTVQVPSNCQVKVETVSSSIELVDLDGEFEVDSVSGDLDLQRLNGKLKAQSVSGPIRGDGLDGSMKFENVSGDIDLKRSQFPALNAKTVSGEIVVQASGQVDPYHFHTISGDLSLILSEEQGVSIQMHSMSGKLHMHHSEGIATQRAPRELSVQGGGPKVSFETISGDLHLTTPELAASDAESPSPHQRDVLESIARGELTAEEGLQALKSSTQG